ncbi:MAG TPA: lysophospholipid acyltransferase family protein [Armatimonadota bacterium]
MSLEKLSKKTPLHKRLERWAGGRAITLVRRLVIALPERSVAGFGRGLGNFFYALSRRYRVLSQQNIRLVYPTMPIREVKQLARQVFIHFGKVGVEFLRVPLLTPEEIDRRAYYVNREHLDAALANGKGVLLISAHLGNWEYLAAKLTQDGYALDALQRAAKDAETTRIVTEVRKGTGIRVYNKGNILPAIRALRDNRILIILADQHDFEGAFADFLGVPAMSATGPAAIALRTGATILPTFTFREPDDTIRIEFHPPFTPEPGPDREEDVRAITQRLCDIISEQIRRAPDQWLWLHDRWRSTREPHLLERFLQKREKEKAPARDADAVNAKGS